ncbi:MAG TPA: class I SAM-dependent methyltransferase [Chitinophagaceae bacterium]|jgi:malonyl-CoA O-methyltransferase|nr:class I SAM-dependent methyltransferase [Chitinophagaceae bacterium]
MQNKEAYNRWSITYDDVVNKTRDVEALAFRSILSKVKFSTAIELGAGTGKNTEWLIKNAEHVIAVDFSEEMLNAAKKKINSNNIEFAIADITKPWIFTDKKNDLITCSLILEHIENIDFVFQQAGQHLNSGGLFYIGELHPFKQYQGSKARFETGSELFTLECFIHNISDYMDAAAKNNFFCLSLTEWFDDNDKNSIPRVIAFLFQKK